MKAEEKPPAPVGVPVAVPFEDGHVISVTYAGSDPVSYEVVDGKVGVAQRHLDEFLAVVEGARPAP